jgi:hypothetical protein
MPPLIATDELVITSMNFPPYSTRTALQTLTPIAAATQLARTANGRLKDISDPDGLFRLFASTITGTDMQVPEFTWPGVEVTVSCIAELGYKTSGGTQLRIAVGGSPRVDGDYTFYRPQMLMRVVSFQITRDDWNAANGWQLDLEESYDIFV